MGDHHERHNQSGAFPKTLELQPMEHSQLPVVSNIQIIQVTSSTHLQCRTVSALSRSFITVTPFSRCVISSFGSPTSKYTFGKDFFACSSCLICLKSMRIIKMT